MDLYITAITVAEISYGIEVLAEGKRRVFLETAFHKAIQASFESRIISFNLKSAYLYGTLMASQKKQGRPMSIPNGQIAAIVLTHEATLATHNTADFLSCGIELIDPFHIPVQND
jgi:predicted nucleic acid-binding protein